MHFEPRRAIGRTIIVLTLAVLLIGAVAAASLTLLTPSPASSTTTTTTYQTDTSVSITSTSYPPVFYQVMRENLTLRGQAAVVPCAGFDESSCPSPSNATLSPVDLIEYGGNYYYLYNQTEVTSSSTATIYMTWFTNSSVVCISPAHPLTNTEHQNPTCPAHPYQRTTIAVPVASASTVNSSIGLRLGLNLSSQSPGAITVAIDLSNTLGRVNNLTAEKHWPSDPTNLYLWTQGGCGPPTDVPFGFAVYQGSLSESDIATSVPLSLEVQLGGLLCPYEAPTPYFAFYPLSDVSATYQYAGIPGLAGHYNITASTTCIRGNGSDCWWSGLNTWSGYWTGSNQQTGSPEQFSGGACPNDQMTSSSTGQQAASTDCPLAFNQFPPGVYTVEAADEWGQVILLHFTVSSSPSSTSSSSSPSQSLYNVTFQQAGACSPPVYVAPWSVTLNGTTKVEPPGGVVSTSGGYSAGPEPASVYTIVFTVPDGVYYYVLAPQSAFYSYNGMVTVDGTNLIVPLEGPAVSCTTTTNPSP